MGTPATPQSISGFFYILFLGGQFMMMMIELNDVISSNELASLADNIEIYCSYLTQFQ